MVSEKRSSSLLLKAGKRLADERDRIAKRLIDLCERPMMAEKENQAFSAMPIACRTMLVGNVLTTVRFHLHQSYSAHFRLNCRITCTWNLSGTGKLTLDFLKKKTKQNRLDPEALQHEMNKIIGENEFSFTEETLVDASCWMNRRSTVVEATLLRHMMEMRVNLPVEYNHASMTDDQLA